MLVVQELEESGHLWSGEHSSEDCQMPPELAQERRLHGHGGARRDHAGLRPGMTKLVPPSGPALVAGPVAGTRPHYSRGCAREQEGRGESRGVWMTDLCHQADAWR